MYEGWRAFPVPIRRLIVCFALTGLAVGAGVAHGAEPSLPCRVSAGTPATVVAIIDERTLRLADGRAVRLAGLASLADAGDSAGSATHAVRARAKLALLVQGKTAALEDLGEDRYGRRLALAAIANDEAGPTLQEQLIAGGHGVVAARVGEPGCAARFLAAERGARTARLGLWAEPHYVIREARAYPALAALRGRFVLVEGAVLSVNDRGATVYVNFGRRWSKDFTVTIAKRNVRNFTAAGLDPQTLAGRRVLVRGWVDERGGPWIEAIRPEQIEFADR